MSYSDDYNGEDIGQYYADQEHAIREANFKPYSWCKVKGKKWGQTKDSKPKDVNLKMDDFNALSELAKDLFQLRQQKAEIVKRAKAKSDDIKALLSKYGMKSIALPDFTVTESERSNTVIDRAKLQLLFPKAYSVCLRKGTDTNAIYVKARDKNDNDE